MEDLEYTKIELLEDIKSDFSERIIPRGTKGCIVEVYEHPTVGYAVDLAIPNPSLVGGFEFENVILYPYQLRVIDSAL
jgi:hypothetical protein